MSDRQQLPLELYQVLEDEYVSLHGQLHDEDVVRLPDHRVAHGYRLVRARRNWFFHRGHIRNPSGLADKLLAASPPTPSGQSQTQRRQKLTVTEKEPGPAEPAAAPDVALFRHIAKAVGRETLLRVTQSVKPPVTNLNALFDSPSDATTQHDEPGTSDATTMPVRTLVQQARNGVAPEVVKEASEAIGALENALNQLLNTPLYTDERFAHVTLPAPLAAILELPDAIDPADRPRVNRWLLELAFPAEIEPISNVRLAAIHQRFHQLPQHAALCLSGGGIRSATFALGLLQGLARGRLLGKFDYLSTVSGGGYVGGWLTGWLYRDPNGLDGVTSALANQPPEVTIDPDPAPLRYLRNFSNFITPKTGLLTADTWTFVALYLRNLLLNWTVIIPLSLAFLMLPRWHVAAVLALPDDTANIAGINVRFYLLAIGALLAVLAVGYTAFNRPRVREQLRVRSPFWFKRADQRSFLTYCLLPLSASATLLTIYWAWSLNVHSNDPVRDWWLYALFGLSVTTAGWLLAVIVLRRYQWRHWRESSKTELGVLALAGAVGGLLFWGTEHLCKRYPLFVGDIDLSWHTWLAEIYAVLAVPIFLNGFLLAMTLFIGLTSHMRKFPDEDREWWARANAWILIVSCCWLAFSGLVIFGPVALSHFPKLVTSIGGLSGIVALLAGRSARTPGVQEPAAKKGITGWLTHVGLPGMALIFLVVLAACMSLLTSAMIVAIGDIALQLNLPDAIDSRVKDVLTIQQQFVRHTGTIGESLRYRHLWSVHYPSFPFTTAIILLFTAIGLIMARAVNLNRFTLHAGYRDRLIRAFLGASRQTADRKPNPFTGLDAADNIQMHELRPALLHEGDFTNIGAFALGLRERRDKISAQLWDRLTGSTRTAIERFSADALPSGMLKVMLIEDLNRALEDQEAPLYADPAFQSMIDTHPQSRENVASLSRSGRGEFGVLVNRWLLQTAYPDYIRRKYPPPHTLFHVVNTTLNLVGGDNLAWQERKAEPFSVTPLHSGCFRLGYRRSVDFGGEDGISLGTAIAISGAAASSNMGYFTTSPVISLVLTLFNVRLGWWLGNPGIAGTDTYRRQSPKYSIAPILQEAFGLTDDKNKYVYLTDGGHFENLAVYEMVLRRCKIIVVSDAGADDRYQFNDLGNAIRKIRIDLGIPVEFSSLPIHGTTLTDSNGAVRTQDGSYWALGRIRYSCVDAGAEDGVLVYIKPAVYGTEPQDVLHYKRAHPTFPHQTTADQFFDEPQFESYRALGSFIMDTILADRQDASLPELVRHLYQAPKGLPGQWPEIHARWLNRPDA